MVVCVTMCVLCLCMTMSMSPPRAPLSLCGAGCMYETVDHTLIKETAASQGACVVAQHLAVKNKTDILVTVHLLREIPSLELTNVFDQASLHVLLGII